ncbi:MAG: cupin domain-containing protein [Planctomycetia bacterium]|nr:cupin domain-containing protein [Planctomycetia bacterium]
MRQILKIHIVFVLLLIVSLFSSEKLQAQERSSIINNLKYVRVYTDSIGESHFEDLTIDLNEIDFAPPAPPIFTSELNPSSKYGFVSVLPGWESEWHPVPKRQFIFYLSGTIEAEVSDGEIRQFGPGSITLVEDTTGKGHKSRVIGSNRVVGVVIQLEE